MTSDVDLHRHESDARRTDDGAPLLLRLSPPKAPERVERLSQLECAELDLSRILTKRNDFAFLTERHDLNAIANSHCAIGRVRRGWNASPFEGASDLRCLVDLF